MIPRLITTCLRRSNIQHITKTSYRYVQTPNVAVPLHPITSTSSVQLLAFPKERTFARSFSKTSKIVQEIPKQRYHLVYAFGGGAEGQLGLKEKHEAMIVPALITAFTKPNPRDPDVPIGLHRFIDIIAGFKQSFAITEDLQVYGWGSNVEGQVGASNITTPTIDEPTLIPQLSGTFNIAAGRTHSLFLTRENKVLSVGATDHGQLGIGKHGEGVPEIKEPVWIESLKDEKIVMIDSGLDHCAALTEHGRVYTWGLGCGGQLGHGDDEDQSIPKMIESIKDIKIVRVACGGDFTALLTDEGEVLTFGNGNLGQLGTGTTEHQFDPEFVEHEIGNKFITSIWCGLAHMLALTSDGEVYSWGQGESGQLGYMDGISLQNLSQITPKRIDALLGKPIYGIYAGGGTSMALSKNELYAWGYGGFGRLGHGSEDNELEPLSVQFFEGKEIVHVATGADHTFVAVEEYEE